MQQIRPLTPLGQTVPAPPAPITLQQMYTWVKAQCHQRFDAINPDFCNSIFPTRPVYLPPPQERSRIKWYWWAAGGYLVAKIL